MGNGFKLKEGKRRLDLYCDSGEVLEQVAQRSSRCSIPGSSQGQAGWSFKQSIEWNVSLPMAQGLEIGDV